MVPVAGEGIVDDEAGKDGQRKWAGLSLKFEEKITRRVVRKTWLRGFGVWRIHPRGENA